MPNEEKTEFETTKELEELTDLNNQIIEVNDNLVNTQEKIQEEQPKSEFFSKPEKVKVKEKIKTWWKKRTKKQRILIISGIVLFFILVIVGIVFLIRTLKKEEEIPIPVPVIVQEENYRYENGVLKFLNKNKEEIGFYTCENQSEELCFVSYYSTEDDFDVEKKVYQNNEPILTRSAIVNETFVLINDNARKEDEKIKLYNMKEQNVVEEYQLAKRVEEGKLIVKNAENKYGIIDLSEATSVTKLEFNYDYLGYIENDKKSYISTQNGRNFIIDETGRTLSKAITGDIKNLNASYVKVKLDNGKYEVYNYNNQNIFNESFDYVELYGDYAVLINDTQAFLRFYDKNKLNEEAVNLKNRDYVKTSIYDEENELIETKEAFSIEENNDIITITVTNNSEDNTTVLINKAEGTLNKSLRNMSYFNGKLYIYSNTEKTNLLGTYTCANKNNVSSGTTSLSNCTLARDTILEDNDYEIPGAVGVIPVFNERFIFISDNPDLVNDSSKTIVLYDLKKSSNLGKYRTVNTYSYTGTNDITFSTVTDLQVVAQNQSGNFGVIKINLAEVVGHIGFNYSSMEKLRDYYVAKDANGYLLLSKSNGASVTSAIPYKIRNYNSKYVKVKRDDGNYYIYDYENKTGKSINTEGFKYVELYDNYFAGVNVNNELGVFTYNRPTQNIISGGTYIPLSLNSYYGNGILAFKISGSEILVGNASNSYIPADQRIEYTSGS